MMTVYTRHKSDLADGGKLGPTLFFINTDSNERWKKSPYTLYTIWGLMMKQSLDTSFLFGQRICQNSSIKAPAWASGRRSAIPRSSLKHEAW